MHNGAIIYSTLGVILQFASIVNKFPEIWVEQDFINIPKEQWIPIILKPDANLKPAQPYFLSIKDKAIINKTHNTLHREGKMEYIT